MSTAKNEIIITFSDSNVITNINYIKDLGYKLNVSRLEILTENKEIFEIFEKEGGYSLGDGALIENPSREIIEKIMAKSLKIAKIDADKASSAISSILSLYEKEISNEVKEQNKQNGLLTWAMMFRAVDEKNKDVLTDKFNEYFGLSFK
jgi:hypothetical protein